MMSWKKILLLVFIIFVTISGFYYLLFSSFFSTTPPIARESYLELNIYGDLPERQSNDLIAETFSGQNLSMEGMLHCIRKAKIDKKIKGIILKPYAGSIGWAKLEELRSALKDFKSANKSVYVYLEAASNREYYLATIGDMIFGSPHGSLLITGLLGGGYFIKGTLDKIGVEPDFITHGKYKDAPEFFTRTSMSESQREVMEDILQDYNSRYKQAISEDRQIALSRVSELLDEGLFSLKETIKDNLIDSLMYYNEFLDYLKKKDGNRVRTVSYERYLKVPPSKLGIRPKDSFALIYGIGDIVTGIGDDSGLDGFITSEGMAQNIRRVAEDKNIKAIILRIDSPGGSTTASDIIWREIAEAKQKKPVVVSMSDVAASGGYYISMAADTILAQPSSIVGSIGIFAGKFSVKDLYNKLGIHKDEMPQSLNADLFSEITTFNDSQRELIYHNMLDFYRNFVEKAAEGRHMTAEEIEEVAQGRIWSGNQAVKIGLVDKIGGLNDAILVAKKMVGIPLDEYVKLTILPKKLSFLQRLISSNLSVKSNLLNRLLPGSVQNYLQGFLFFKNYEPLILMPFYPEIK